MNERPPITADDEFWFLAYTLYIEEVNSVPGSSFDMFEIARTVRVPFDGAAPPESRQPPLPSQ